MYSLHKFAGRAGVTGTPLPDVFHSFAMNRITFRAGHTSMIAAPPNSFKSVLALNIMVHWAVLGKSVLYFSADSDEFTVAKRTGAILLDHDVDLVETRYLKGEMDQYITALRQLTRVQFDYSQMDMPDLALRVKSFEAIHGAYPDVIFIDSLLSYVGGDDEWPAMRQMTKDLDALARETSAHVTVLHHSSESDADPSRPPPRARVQGKITQVPRLVITAGRQGMALPLACVKNTNGPSDPLARNVLQFMVEPSLRIRDISYEMELA